MFGQYRHVLEKRGEAALEAAMSIWKEYLVAILRAIDDMPGEAEVERPLVVSTSSDLSRVRSARRSSLITHSLRMINMSPRTTENNGPVSPKI